MINYRQNKQEILMLYTPNEIVDLYLKQCIANDKQKQEIERLNNNWNELRKWIVNNKHNENTEERYLVVDYGTLLGKMNELKGVDEK